MQAYKINARLGVALQVMINQAKPVRTHTLPY
jgi:hypothetical protein